MGGNTNTQKKTHEENERRTKETQTIHEITWMSLIILDRTIDQCVRDHFCRIWCELMPGKVLRLQSHTIMWMWRARKHFVTSTNIEQFFFSCVIDLHIVVRSDTSRQELASFGKRTFHIVWTEHTLSIWFEALFNFSEERKEVSEPYPLDSWIPPLRSVYDDYTQNKVYFRVEVTRNLPPESRNNQNAQRSYHEKMQIKFSLILTVARSIISLEVSHHR